MTQPSLLLFQSVREHVSPEVPGTQPAWFRPEGGMKEHVGVLLVDDHALVRQGLKTLLESYADVQVVGEACNGEEALGLVERLRPTVVVMGIKAERHRRDDSPESPLSRSHRHRFVVQCRRRNQEAMRRAGASRLISKDVAVEQLYAAIKEISCYRASVSHS